MKTRLFHLASGLLLLGAGWPISSGCGAPAEPPSAPTVTISTTATPPEWALWERHLLAALYPPALEFVHKYTRPDGTLIWRAKWPGMDGSDDGYESFYNFALYYALGGPEPMRALASKLWEAVTRQFTRYGQVYKEFDGYYDWMHHGESYVSFYFFGLVDPKDPKLVARARRFAGFYLNEDPQALNYDPQRRLILSPITGSRGPRWVNSATDWVTHRPVLANYPLPYDDIPNVTAGSAWVDDAKFPFILEAMNQRMMRGDVPLNLTATSLMLHAFMLTGEAKYRHWVEDYVSAWSERARANGGVLPDNVGLSGKIGEYMGGKWWGGYYGWRWPHGLMNQVEATLIGGANACLVSGDAGFLELPRSVIKLAQGLAKLDNGRWVVPHRHGDGGWYDYRPLNPSYLIHLWYFSQNQEDYDRLAALADTSAWDSLRYRKGKGDYGHEGPWLRFLEGKNPGYPVQILKANYQETLRRLELIRHDQSLPPERDVHHWQERNPVVLEGLVQTTLGGPNHIYHGGLLHVRVRYFDPVGRRAGLPPDVAALVDRVAAETISLELVNLHPSEPRQLVLQAGAFGEHQFSRVSSGGQTTEVNGKWLRVRMEPGTVGRLEIGLKRFVNPPAYATPW